MGLALCLWSNNNSVEMAEYYTSLFPDSTITNTTFSASDNPSVGKGDVLFVEIDLMGMKIIILNGGAQFPFTEAFSFQLPLPTQQESDDVYDALLNDGGQPGQCGWLKDKFGISWQIFPSDLTKYVNGPNREGAERAMQAMLTMERIDIDALRLAYAKPE